MRSAEPDADAGIVEPIEPWHPSPRLRRTALAVGLLLLSLFCARNARTEVRYERQPVPLSDEEKDLVAGSSGGTGCGGWPQRIAPSVRPSTPDEGAALWADAELFHVTHERFFVRSVRVDVEGGTAQMTGGDPQGSLVIPLDVGKVADFTVACRATSMSIHFMGADGAEFTDLDVRVGDGTPTRSPVEVAKGEEGISSQPCTKVAAASDGLTEGSSPEDQHAALEQLIEVGTSIVGSSELSEEEERALTIALQVGKERADAIARRDPSAYRPMDPEQIDALDRVAKLFQRLCPSTS